MNWVLYFLVVGIGLLGWLALDVLYDIKKAINEQAEAEEEKVNTLLQIHECIELLQEKLAPTRAQREEQRTRPRQ
jgi:hypothetical protein